MQAGGNMEGKEVRFGIANSALFTTITTDASCGAVNTMHDSLMPLGGMIPMINIKLGEIIFGGVGSGLYGMLLFAIIAVFVAGLMVGRTPEYLGKKIEAKEVKMAMLAILILPLSILGFTALATVLPAGPCRAGSMPGRTASARSSTPTPRPPATMAAPLPASPPTRCSTTSTLGFAMLIGRFLMIVPMLAVAGSLAAKKIVPPSAGTFPTDGGAVRRPADRRDPDRRRSHLFPRARARPHRRAFRDAGRQSSTEVEHHGRPSRTAGVEKPASARTPPR